MKPHLVAVMVIISTSAFAQNKTLGIGTAANNPNAALHVESPTNNQGFIMPRLSTVQRTAISLATPDAGLMVYDRDINKPYYWDGASWHPAAGLSLPFVSNDANATVSFSITNTGLGYASTFLNSGTGGAAQFSISNPGSTAPVVSIVHTGSGNALTANAPIQATQFIGDGSLLTNLPASNLALPYSATFNSALPVFEINANGTGHAANFRITNVGSTSTALNAVNDGAGGSYAIYGQSNGGGRALGIQNTATANAEPVLVASHEGLGIVGQFLANNASNGSPSLHAVNAGTGNAASFVISNAVSTGAVLNINHAGTGNAITANRPIQATSFIGDGSLLTGLPSFSLPFTGSSSTGAVSFDVTNIGTGNAGYFSITNASNGSPSLSAYTAGTGHALNVQVANASNNFAALNVDHAGTGNAIHAESDGTGATILIDRNTGTGDGLSINHAASFGKAASFISSATENTASAVTVNYAGTGIGLEVLNTGSGLSSALFSRNTGSGRAFSANISNPSNSSDVMTAGTDGIGRVALFGIDNATNNNSSIFAYTVGTGSAMTLNVNNVSNSTAVLNITGNGTGQSILADGVIEATQFVGDGSLLTNLPSSGWGLGGNAGTDAASDFIGTTDAQDFILKSNNTEAIRILPSGQVGFGTSPISARVDVSNTTTSIGLHASVAAATGVQNRALQGYGAGSSAQNFGVYGTGDLATGTMAIGVYGEAIGTGSGDAVGLYGNTNNFTSTTGTAYGLFASAENGATNWAGYFSLGDVAIEGKLALGAGNDFGTSGYVLTSQGNSSSPTWAAPDITVSAATESVYAGSGVGSGNQSVLLGNQAGASSTANGNTFIGNYTGNATTSGTTNTFLGWEAGRYNLTGISNIALGAGAGNGITGVTMTTGSNNILIGTHADIGTDGLTDAVAIGNGSVVNANNSIVLGSSLTNVGIGLTTPTARLHVSSIDNTANAGDFRITNGLSSGNVLNVVNSGTGNAFLLQNNGTAAAVSVTHSNTGSGTPALYVQNSGGAHAGHFWTNNAGSNGTAVFGQTDGTGNAGFFMVNNPSNSLPGLISQHNGTGPAFQANHINNGIGIDITSGTLKYSVFSTGTATITTRAGVYHITASGTYTLPTASVAEGETCLVYNGVGPSITVEGITINSGIVRQFIRINSAWRVVN